MRQHHQIRVMRVCELLTFKPLLDDLASIRRLVLFLLIPLILTCQVNGRIFFLMVEFFLTFIFSKLAIFKAKIMVNQQTPREFVLDCTINKNKQNIHFTMSSRQLVELQKHDNRILTLPVISKVQIYFLLSSFHSSIQLRFNPISRIGGV